MSVSESLYSTYLVLRCHLIEWKPQLLPSEVLEGLAGEAIADLVEKGLAGQILAHGPYVEAFNTMRSLLNLMCPQAWDAGPLVWADEMPVPTESFLKEVCYAYGALFDIAFEADLTYRDVLMIKALISVGRPQTQAEATLAELITLGASHLEPLRRCFWAAEEHEADKLPTCKLSGRIGQREWMASERWLEQRYGKEVSC